MTHTHSQPQTNSHILVQDFDYFEPSSMIEALELCNRYKERCSLVAGGTHLYIMMKMERNHPEVVINIKNLPELKQFYINNARELVIGACTSIYDLRQNPAVQNLFPALAQACQAFGSTHIQIMGTIGGNLCNGSPASDTIPALLIYNARLSITGPSGVREIPVKDFLLGPGKIALKDGEILTSVTLPLPSKNAVSTFIKVSRVAADLAKVNIAMLLERQNDTVIDCRLAFGSVSPTVIRTEKVEQFVKGKKYSDEMALSAGEIASDCISPIDDARSTVSYRKEIVKVMTHDVLAILWNQNPKPALDDRIEPHALRHNISETVHVPASTRKEITLNINGMDRHISVYPNELLINVLREKFQLTGTKYGCGLGECSACTVLVDGRASLSCLLLAVAMEGRKIVTIEGLQAKDGSLDPLQESFIENSAFQCGYCTPGIIMTVKSLINENPIPVEDDVRDYLKGNRCRCTGYISITRAIMSFVDRHKLNNS